PMGAPAEYGGIDTREVMEVARTSRDFLLAAIEKAVGPPSDAGAMLDFGAGTASHALALRDRGYDVSAVELDDRLRSRLIDAGFEAHGTISEFDGQFDAVYSINVLEHIHDDAS